MREALKEIEGSRQTFTATFHRYGRKTGWQGKPVVTLLFRSVKNADGKEVADHIWFDMNETFKKMVFVPGEAIQFDARVTPYQKGYKGHRELEDAAPVTTDYRLSHPTHIVRCEEVKSHQVLMAI